jgi:hypothetical protein
MIAPSHEPLNVELLRPRAGPRKKWWLSAESVCQSRASTSGRDEATTASSGKQVSQRMRVAYARRPQSARRSVPRACCLCSPPAMDPGVSTPPVFPELRPGPPRDDDDSRDKRGGGQQKVPYQTLADGVAHAPGECGLGAPNVEVKPAGLIR